ncbi:membrane associated DnaJ chaperone-like protein [Trichodelitschia bisporula]|uniref:Membrane associated DnaJ chaperone-like protein n=1 Tax=Trichodelitschia bisporula TaxID=703511 RepID=A0A6G1IA30_9PEZI|nr:membrane associated DnaJ chaperone-like protein [Trichodelitschia bisporula]
MSSQLFSWGAWYVLPNLVTGWLQTFYYRITLRAGEHQPRPGEPRWAKHRKNIFILVIAAYLLYTIYEADWELQRASTFYRDLSVPVDADERTIRTQFRKISVRLHPDKVMPEFRQQAEAGFIHLKQAHDVLTDPAKRFAYDRFGQIILQWRSCKTVFDFVVTGAQTIAPYYLGSALMLVVMSVLGYMEDGRYWRYLALAAMLVFEAHTITRPDFPPLVARLINPLCTTLRLRPPYLPFQAIILARKIALSFFIAVAQLTPLFRSPTNQGNVEVVQRQTIDQLALLIGAVDGNVKKLLELELTPFADDPSAEDRLQQQLTAWLVQNEIRNNPEVSGAIKRAMERRRTTTEGDDST